MRTFYRKALTASFFLLFASSLIAQEKKEEEKKVIFSNVENEYRSGRVGHAIEMLQFWLGKEKHISDLNRANRAAVYRLAAHCYILADKPDSAQRYVKKMLLIWPDYKERRARAIDLERFRMSIDTLYALPKLQVGIQAGTNYTLVNELAYYSVMQYEDAIEPNITRSSTPSFQVSLAVEYDFSKYFSLSIEPGLNSMTHTFDRTYSGSSTGLDAVSYSERLTYIDVDALINFKLFPRSKNRLLVGAGPTWAFLYNSSKEIEGTNSSLSSASSMNSRLNGVLARIGYYHKFYNYSLGVDFNFIHYFNKVNNSKARYINDPQDAVFTYGFYSIPDDIKFRNLQVNVTFRYAINYKVYH